MNTLIIVLILVFILIILGVIGYFIYKYIKSKEPCPQNDISNYDIGEIPIKGSDLLQRIFTRVSMVMNRIKERFALSPGTVTNLSSLVSGTRYTRGTLKLGVSNTVTGPKNGGVNCSPFPTTIYTPEGSVPIAISDPCSGYSGSSIRVSNDCYRKLWANAGCGGDPFLIPDKQKWNSFQTLDTLRGDVNNWYYYAKVLKNPYHAQYCK